MPAGSTGLNTAIRTLAVIPARGGSKRIPRKNILPFAGQPIIAWSIQAARDAGCFDAIIVSTDDDEIAAVAGEHGADIPFMRPADLADDFSDTRSVISHAQQWYLDRGEPLTHVCCIYATAPFVQADDLRQGFELLKSTGCDYVLPVAEYSYPVQRAVTLDENRRMHMLYPDKFSSRSQDLERIYHDAGQFYWGTTDSWNSDTPIFGPHSTALPIPSWRVQDIDTLDDWRRAELAFAMLQGDGGR